MDPRTRRLVTLGVLGLLVVGLLVGAWRNSSQAAETASPIREEQQLAEKYVPVVIVRVQEEECGPGEPYRPVPVTAVLGDPQVRLVAPDGRVVTKAPTARDLAGLGDGYYLDFPGDPLEPDCDFEEWFRSKQDVPTAVNARIATDPDHPGMLVLQYWFFWVFNDWNDKHEGDWEMIQLVFEADDVAEALTTQPESVAFAQHDGVEVAEWDSPKVLREGEHVAVYPAEGSHAAYFTQSQWFGKSAAAGFGCDNTGLSDGLDATLLRPSVVMVHDTTPWLTYGGRWGEIAPSFNNGPTGPNLKEQWTHPVTWQEEKGRDSAVALPTAMSSAEETFCTLTAAGSLLFIEMLANPLLVLVTGLIIVVLVWLLVRSTTWRGSPPEPDRERSAGQILAGGLDLVRHNLGPFSAVILALMGLLLVSYWVQIILQRPVPTSDLTRVGAPDLTGGDWLGLLLAGVVTFLLAALCVSVAVGITPGLPDPDTAVVARSRGARRGVWRSVVTYLALTACVVTVVLIPLAVFLLARWAVSRRRSSRTNGWGRPDGGAGR
ncbi:MAG: hypothetical protein U0R64_08485 [Candidatus Nanopelagicales bacterium]